MHNNERRSVEALEGAGGAGGASGIKKWGGGYDGYKQKVAEMTAERLGQNANQGGVSTTGVTGGGNTQFSGGENQNQQNQRGNSQRGVVKAELRPADGFEGKAPPTPDGGFAANEVKFV